MKKMLSILTLVVMLASGVAHAESIKVLNSANSKDINYYKTESENLMKKCFKKLYFLDYVSDHVEGLDERWYCCCHFFNDIFNPFENRLSWIYDLFLVGLYKEAYDRLIELDDMIKPSILSAYTLKDENTLRNIYNIYKEKMIHQDFNNFDESFKENYYKKASFLSLLSYLVGYNKNISYFIKKDGKIVNYSEYKESRDELVESRDELVESRDEFVDDIGLSMKIELSEDFTPYFKKDNETIWQLLTNQERESGIYFGYCKPGYFTYFGREYNLNKSLSESLSFRLKARMAALQIKTS